MDIEARSGAGIGGLHEPDFPWCSRLLRCRRVLAYVVTPPFLDVMTGTCSDKTGWVLAVTPHFSLSLPIVLAEASTSGKEADQNCENIALLLSSSPTELRPSPAGHATNHSIEGHPARDDFTESCSDTL